MNPELHLRLAADRRATDLADAERHRLARSPSGDGEPAARPARRHPVRRAVGRRLVGLGQHLLEGAGSPVRPA